MWVTCGWRVEDAEKEIDRQAFAYRHETLQTDWLELLFPIHNVVGSDIGHVSPREIMKLDVIWN
jgi:hypothetical protein